MEDVPLEDNKKISNRGFLLRIVYAILNFFKSLNCKIKSCCGCESSCNSKEVKQS